MCYLQEVESMNAFKSINLVTVRCLVVKKIKGGNHVHTPLIFVVAVDEVTLFLSYSRKFVSYIS